MRALRISEETDRPEVVNLEAPRPGAGQVVLRVGAYGVSNTRLRLNSQTSASDRSGLADRDCGDEVAGWVHAVGTGVHGVQVSQPVAVLGIHGCGTCRNCLRDEENYCINHRLRHVVRYLDEASPLDELILVKDPHQLVPLPEGVDPLTAAPLTGAGLTAYHAVKAVADRLTPGATAFVIGSGAVGHLAIQLIRALTEARVVVADRRRAALTLAERCGAEVCVEVDRQAEGLVHDAIGHGGAQVVLDTVGSCHSLQLAVSCVAPAGCIEITGWGGGALSVSITEVPFGLTVHPTVLGTRRELAEVLELASLRKITPEITTYSLGGGRDAYSDVSRGRVVGCAVIRMDPLPAQATAPPIS